MPKLVSIPVLLLPALTISPLIPLLIWVLARPRRLVIWNRTLMLVSTIVMIFLMKSTKLKLWAAYLGFFGILDKIPLIYCYGYFTIAFFILTTILETNKWKNSCSFLSMVRPRCLLVLSVLSYWKEFLMLDIFVYLAFAGLCVIIIMAAVELFIDMCAKISNLIFMWMERKK